MSKMPNRTPVKMETKGSGDVKRDSSTSRNDRNDKSHNQSRSESSSRNKHDRDHHKEANDGNENTEHKNTDDKKFTGRCRLFVGNLTSDVTEDDFKKLFSTYGEVSEVYVNSGRGFGFIRMDYRQNAEAAKAALDGLQRKGRVLRVRFATHAAALRVKHLHPYVSNELLEQAFAQFGEIERAVVIVDERGKSTGEGLVEFTRKPGAQQALRRISEGVFLFGVDPKPIEVEPLEHKDEEDGLPEKLLTKNDQYKKEREKEPHFAPKASFEFEFGMRWKQLADMEKKRIDNVKQEMEDARLKLEDEMQNALYEYQAEQIRQDLVRQQEELRRLEELRNQDRMRRQQELEMRSMSRRAEEERDRQQEDRRRQEMMMRQQEMQRRSGGGSMDSGMPRSREEMMAMRGEGGFPGGMGGDGRGGAPPMQPPPAPPSGMGLDRGGPQGMPMERGGGMGMERGGGPQGGMDRGGRPGMGMERGGPQGMGGMERGGGPQGMERGGGGPQGMGMDRPGQSGMGMERGGGQQAMSRMQPGGGGQGGGGPNPSGSGSPNVNMGGQGGGQMETDTFDPECDREAAEASTSSSAPPLEIWTEASSAAIQRSQSASTPSQFEDADDECNTTSEHTAACEDGQWLAPPEGGKTSNRDTIVGEEKHSVSDGGARSDGHNFQQCEPTNWTWERTGEKTWKVTGSFMDPSNFSDADTECENSNQASLSVSVEGAVLDRTNVNDDRLNTSVSESVDMMNVSDDGDVVNSYNAESSSGGHWMEVQDSNQYTEQEQSSHNAQNFETDPSWDTQTQSFETDPSWESQTQNFETDPSWNTQTQNYETDPSWGTQNLGHNPSYLAESHDSENFAAYEGGISGENNPDGQNLTDPDSSYAEGQNLAGPDSSCVEGQNVIDTDSSYVEGQNLTDPDSSYPEPDYSMALVPYVPPDSPSSSSSSSTSPRPHPHHGAGPNVATAATGIPLHQNPLGMGQPRFVRIHPMHIAAAVAAQHSQAAAAMMHQQTRMAAAAAMQHQAAAAAQHQAAAAAVRHQAAAAVRHQATAAMAAAAQQQRTRAALLHQQLVRSRYMGAPVLVRQPFVPVPRVAAPMRVRMRLRRSVILSEELNLHQP